jgi:uncharacterized protein (DUF488 family)
MPSARPRLWTIGYQRRNLSGLLGQLANERISLLLDVRETPWSHKPGFSKSVLERRLSRAGIGYLHVTYAGNPKWIRELSASHAECLANYSGYLAEHRDIVEAFRDLVAELHADGHRLVLLCYERCAEECHRTILANKWATLAGGLVSHIGSDGLHRLMAS